jgi:hypothetical protein
MKSRRWPSMDRRELGRRYLGLTLFASALAASGCTPQVTGGLVDALSKIPEIQARTFEVKVNHVDKTICVHAVVRNLGGQDVKGPFTIDIGVRA